ncbi:polysaccharide pyruvyl transferase family protein [Pasteurellaceae bacterium LIM206]|nr:polysaccharide pyruvyl transferase family protein [Pasteurellaceae bacterium LIM206]
MNSTLLSLKQELQKIVTLIKDKDDVLYFDYPMHLNVGDLLIYAGTEQFFLDYRINIRLRRSLQAFQVNEVKKYVKPNTTILCHGGGNFGDLYPAIQKLREDLVRTFPRNRIIVLPQTAHFSCPTALEKSAALFSQHPDCHLFARDVATAQLMRAFSPHVQLCPDMAHQLYGNLKGREPGLNESNKTLYFLRKDIEASDIEKRIRSRLSASDVVKDWNDVLLPRDLWFEKLCSKIGKLANKLHLTWVKNKLNDVWYRYSLGVIEHCRVEFLCYDLIVTSRLHGHIFACLLGIPNQVCDNSYGKNSGYYNQWTKDIDYAQTYQK